MSYIVEMRGINKSFPGVQALTNAQLLLEKGEVLGLIGENGAGKSTLVNILSGLFPQDSGDLIIKGKKTHLSSPHDALMMGISMIHQEICLVPELTVADNIWIGRENKFTNLGIIDVSKMQQAAQNLMNKYGITLNCKRPVSSLSIAEMQLVEIIRAVSYDSDIIIMDEPTSTLTTREIDILYRIIDKLKENKVSFIFISHKIEELLQTCDRITVMRDSKYIDTLKTSGTNSETLISLMVGRELKNYFQKKESKIGDVVLEIKNFTRTGAFVDINFQLHKGEILGISGLVGAGRSEIVQALFGIDKPTSGEIYIGGKRVTIKSPTDAINHGIAMVTEDRAQSGLVLGMRIFHNITLVILKQLCIAGFIRNKLDELTSIEKIEKLQIKVSGKTQLASQLSGGNQQKVVLAKWLLTNPKVLILDEPTRGIDVGSKSEIYKLMNELTDQGLAMIMISSELPEVLGMSDRILVIREGKVNYECSRDDATQEKIIEFAFGSAKAK
jgi:inositol transport system ATP-binding protein